MSKMYEECDKCINYVDDRCIAKECFREDKYYQFIKFGGMFGAY